VAAVRPRPAVRVVVAQPVVVAAAEREAVAAAAAARACDRASEEAVGIVLVVSRRVAAAVTVWRSASLSVVGKAGDRKEDESDPDSTGPPFSWWAARRRAKERSWHDTHSSSRMARGSYRR